MEESRKEERTVRDMKKLWKERRERKAEGERGLSVYNKPQEI